MFFRRSTIGQFWHVCTALACGIFFHSFLKAQSANPFTHRVLTRYYPVEYLQQLQATDSARFAYTCFYFMSSFQADSLSCSGCGPYRPDLIDMRLADNLRLPYLRYTYTDSVHGALVTLYSRQELQNMQQYGTLIVPGAEKGITLTALPPDFPEYVDTGNPATDLQNYLTAKQNWMTTHPQRYALYRRSPHILIVNAQEFLTMPASRQQYILQHQSTHLLE